MHPIAVAAEDHAWNTWLAAVAGRVRRARGPLFTTDAEGLFATFLDALPAELRPLHVCSACRSFVQRWGGLVTLDAAGRPEPLLWDSSAGDGPFGDAARALAAQVRGAKVTGVRLPTDAAWGSPGAGAWTHLSAVAGEALLFRPAPGSRAGEAEAALGEAHRLVLDGLDRFDRGLVERAVTLLRSGRLARSEKAVGVAEWLLGLHRAVRAHPGARANLVWRAVATAPPGHAHVRSSVFGTLLEDLGAGLPFEALKARWDAKLHPLQYLRPQAEPRAGNVARAERLVAEMGLAPAFPRRFARLEDVVTSWRPARPQRSGVFAHLGRRKGSPLELPAESLSWARFARDVLPGAEAVELHVPDAAAAYSALVTAVDASAPPVLQWDLPERRNPVSWYTYVGGSRPRDWNLSAGAWVVVTAVTRLPPAWTQPASTHHGDGVFLLLEGARDLRHTAGGGWFPEFLQAELHAVRATLEAYARSARIAEGERATACGLALRSGGACAARVRVTGGGARGVYTIDRWE